MRWGRLRLAGPAFGATAALAVLGACAFASPEERLKPGLGADAAALLDRAHELINTQPKDALDLTGEALTRSDRPSEEFLARLHYVRARASTHMSRHKDAVAEGEVALELLGGAPSKLRGDVLTTMAISLGRSGETRRSYELQQEALAVWRTLDNPAGEAMSLGAIAELYFDIGLTEKGKQAFEEAIARARAAGDRHILAATLNNFGYFLENEGEYARAAAPIDEALSLVDGISPRLATYVMLNAASVRYHTGRAAEAAVLLREGAPMAEKTGSPVLLMGAELIASRLARDSGELETARAHAERALHHARTTRSDRHLSEITKLLADITEKLGDHTAAYHYLIEHAGHLAANAEAASDRSAALFEAETLLGEREQEVELLRRDSQIAKLAVARAEIRRNAAILGSLLLAGAVVSLILLLREKARAKTSIELKNRELVDAYDKLEAADRNKSNFLSVMSHELKTPLNSIIGFSDLLAKANSENASTLEFAKIINVQGRNLLRMVSEILLFTGSSEATLALDEAPEKVADILAAAALAAGEMRQDAHHRIDIEAGDEVVVCDLQQLAYCIARLLDNALKFSPPASRVSLGAKRTAGGELEITVSDEGPGIDRDDVPELFAVLSQGDQSLTRCQQGAGLGLPVASRIADAHGGYIAVEPKPTGGVTVGVVLPAARLTGPGSRAAAA